MLLDPDVLAHFKKDGKGWQTRVNAALRQAAGLKTQSPKNVIISSRPDQLWFFSFANRTVALWILLI